MKKPKSASSRCLAVAIAVALAVAACGGNGAAEGEQPTSTTRPIATTTTEATSATSEPMDDIVMGAAATETAASGLRSLLTAQLQEHVYLAGIAVFNAVNNPDAFEASAATLDQNSQDLAGSIASVYGDDAGAAFLELWRTHIGFFVDYTGARASGDQAGQDTAREGLNAYREDFGAFLESANPNLPKDAVATELQPHVDSVFAAIDAVVDGEPDAFDKLKTAAGHMPMTAAVLAGGIDAQMELEGAVDSPASDLRALLTAQLQEHVYLAGIAVYAAVAAPDFFEASAATLDQNSQDLAGSIASVYGDDAGAAFLELWRTHIGFFVDYTTARASGDQAGQDTAREGLDSYREDFGAFLESANPNLPKDAVATELQPHVDSVFAAIDAVVDGEPDAFDKLKTAAGHMPMTAAVLAGGIDAQMELEGAVDSPASDLRALLTAQLQEHVYLAGIAVYAAVAAPDFFEASAATLDQNSQDLAGSIASVYGDDAGAAFLELWRTHIGFFVDYTTARASGDQAGQDTAREGLDSYREDFGAFLESANPNLPKDAVATELQPHVDSVFAAIDAVVDGEPDAFDKLKTAAGHMPMTAAVLAAGIAEQMGMEG